MSDTSATQRYDSADAATTAATEDDRHSIARYLGDMLALERHMRAPLDRQINDEDTAKFGDAAAIVRKLRTHVDAHEAVLDSQLRALGGDGAAGVKSAWSGFLGAGAAAISGSRSAKVSKGLRDDYTALALATISYTMLLTTALGYGDETTAAIAKRNLDDYTPIVVEISKALPAIVLEELRDAGEDVRVTAAQVAERFQTQSWHAAS